MVKRAEPVDAEVLRLRKEISAHNKRYYQDSRPTVTDSEYDALVRRLKELEGENPGLFDSASPTGLVGGKPAKAFAPVKHSAPMLSLDNSYSPEEIKTFDERVRKALKRAPAAYFCEAKIDGVSIALKYVDGALVRAATRGDGETGEDITPNAGTIKSVPRKLAGRMLPGVLEIRGEIFLTKKEFARINKDLNAAGDEPFVNARNCASGSLRQKDPAVTGSRNLSFYAHSFGRIEGGPAFARHSEFLERCGEWGLPVCAETKVCASVEEVLAHYVDFGARSERLDFEVDGLVAKVDSREEQSILGATSKSPRWALALKYPGKQATSVLEGVEYSVGRTGTITPVAKIKPVFLSGVTISSVSLHNFDEIDRLGVKVGDSVVVERAGEVIPKIVAVAPGGRKKGLKAVKIPKTCPVCKGAVQKEEDAVAVRCVNPSCPAQLKRKLLHFTCRDGLDVEGFGDAVVDQLVDSGRVRDLADVFGLAAEDLLKLELFAEKKAENLLKAIAAAKERPLSRVLFSLGIPQVGEKTARDLAAKFPAMDVLAAADAAALEGVPDVGPVVAAAVSGFFAQDAVAALLTKLKKAGLGMVEPDSAIPQDSRLAGKTFVFTGELSGMTRDEAEAKIRMLGGKAVGSVSKKTGFVVVGAEPGSKAEKAKTLGVPVLDEAAFLELIK